MTPPLSRDALLYLKARVGLRVETYGWSAARFTAARNEARQWVAALRETEGA